MKTALVLIDIQNDYFPGGAMELEGAEAAGEKAGALLAAARACGAVVCHVQHVAAYEGATFFLPDTEEAEFHASVAPAEGEKVIVKHFPNSFRDTSLKGYLESQGVGRIVFAGMMSHMCVDATVRAAFDQGYQCLVAYDACATRGLEWHGAHVPAAEVHASFMAALGTAYAVMVTAEEAAQGLAQCG